MSAPFCAVPLGRTDGGWHRCPNAAGVHVVLARRWLDQLKQQPQHQNHLRSSMQDQQLQQQQHNNLRASMQEQQLQLEQQLSQLQLPSHHTLPQQHSQQQLHSTAHAAAAGSSQHTGQLWQETSQLQLGPGATAAHGSGDGGGAQTHRWAASLAAHLLAALPVSHACVRLVTADSVT